MADHIASTSRGLTRTLEDKVRKSRLINQELERQKAARTLEEELQLLKDRN